MSDFLASALAEVDWNANAANFLADKERSKRLSACVEHLALWSFEIRKADPDNPALAFVVEMHAAALSVTAAVALGLYKAGAAGIRSIVEASLYFSYFKDHPVELLTLVNNDKYHLSRRDIIEYHKVHSRDFLKKQEKFGYIGELEKWYSRVSAIVHGQIPGIWTTRNLDATAYIEETLEEVIKEFEIATSFVRQILLMTVCPVYWGSFSPGSKIKFIKGLPADTKAVLGLSLQ